MAPEKVVVLLPSKVVVPDEWVNVPWFVQLPATVKEEEVGAIRVEEVEIVKLLLMSNDGLLVVALTVTTFVPLPMVKLLLMIKFPDPRLYVGEPAPEGARLRL